MNKKVEKDVHGEKREPNFMFHQKYIQQKY